MKIKIIQLLCVLVLFGCQKNDIDVFNGSNTSLAKLNGNWIVVNYWADWCAPCIKEIPELNEFARENDDLLVFTFNFDFLEVDDLEPIAERFNIEVPSLITHPNEIWGIDTPPAVPATFFINPAGEVVLSLFRPQTKEELNRIYMHWSTEIIDSPYRSDNKFPSMGGRYDKFRELLDDSDGPNSWVEFWEEIK